MLYIYFLRRLTKLFSRQNLYKYLKEEIANIKENSKILNVGSGGQVGKLISSIKNAEVTTIDVLANDTDIDGNVATLSSATNGSNGSTAINAATGEITDAIIEKLV